MQKGAWLTFVKIVIGTLAIWLLYVWFIDEGAPPVAREVV